MSRNQEDETQREIVRLRLEVHRLENQVLTSQRTAQVMTKQFYEAMSESERLRKESADWQEQYHTLNEQVAKFLGREGDKP